MKIIVSLLIFLMLLGCQKKTDIEEKMSTRTQVLMGTLVSITLPSKYPQNISQSFTHIKEIENSLSSYASHASMYKLNQKHHISYDNYVAEALQLSKLYFQETEGYFDVTIGSITKKLYHFGEENTSIPTQKKLHNAMLNIDGISISPQSIRTKKGITVDLGGIGKGFAVDKISTYLNEQNISKGIIALSGDIRCLNVCTLALQSPYTEQTFATITSTIPQLSISTSGTYRRYIESKEHHHLIDPKMATQGKAFASVSLFAHKNNAKIDAYATAISVMPKQKALHFLKQHQEIGFVLVESKGNILYGNLEKFLTLVWLDYKEKTSRPKTKINTHTNNPIATNLIHPDTSNPKEISR